MKGRSRIIALTCSASAQFLRDAGGEASIRRRHRVEAMNAILKEDPPELQERIECPATAGPELYHCLKRIRKRLWSAHDVVCAGAVLDSAVRCGWRNSCHKPAVATMAALMRSSTAGRCCSLLLTRHTSKPRACSAGCNSSAAWGWILGQHHAASSDFAKRKIPCHCCNA